MPKIAYFHKKLTKVVTFDTAPNFIISTIGFAALTYGYSNSTLTGCNENYYHFYQSAINDNDLIRY